MPKVKLIHKHMKNAARNELYDKAFYWTNRWRKMRAYILNNEGLCRICAAEDRTTEAQTVDHIIPRRIRPDLELEPSNLQPLCWQCHSKKTNEDKKKYK